MHLLFLFLFLMSAENVLSLRNVRVEFPKSVTEGEVVTLLCLYDLQGEKLYSVKWYRGIYEFYRYLPLEKPRARIFHIPGLLVDLNTSNAHRLTLIDFPKRLSGNFTCEVTVDEEPYVTGSVTEFLHVIPKEIQEKALFGNFVKPEEKNFQNVSQISGEKSFYISKSLVIIIFIFRDLLLKYMF